MLSECLSSDSPTATWESRTWVQAPGSYALGLYGSLIWYALCRLPGNSFCDQSTTQFCSPSLRPTPGPPPGPLAWIPDCSSLQTDPSLSLLPSIAPSQQSDLIQIPPTTPFTVSHLLPVFVMPPNPEDLTQFCLSDPTTHQLPRDYFHPVAQPPFSPWLSLLTSPHTNFFPPVECSSHSLPTPATLQTSEWLTLTSFKSLCKCHLLHEVFPDYDI